MSKPDGNRRGPIGIVADFRRDEPGCAGIVIFWMLCGAATGLMAWLGLGPFTDY